jgi:hypothetical protein
VSPSSAKVLSGQSATFTVKFAPKGSSAYGALTGTLTLTDNAGALNTPGATQTVSLAGTAYPPSPVVSTQAASDNEDGYVTLNGTALSQGPSATYYFNYGTRPDQLTSQTLPLTLASSTVAAPEGAVIPTSSGLVYYYQLVASNLAGTSYGNVESFTTQPDPPTIWTRYSHLKLSRLLTHGDSIGIQTGQASKTVVDLFIRTATAKAAGIRVPKGATRVSLDRANVTLKAGVPKAIVLKPDSGDAKKLAKLPHVQFTVEAVATANATQSSPQDLVGTYKD